MKQLETKNLKFFNNVLDFYREIGIDITVYDKFFCKEPFLFKNNKKNIRPEINHHSKTNSYAEELSKAIKRPRMPTIIQNHSKINTFNENQQNPFTKSRVTYFSGKFLAGFHDFQEIFLNI